MQMKKTHDAAMVIIERIYSERPRFNYYIGNSQGGREGLTVAQRYPADYDGIGATVPVVGLSSLQLAPVLIRLQEKPVANWVTMAKVNAIRAEFMRQCDKLDGLSDGIINNYMACRAIFDISEGPPNRRPWAAKRCPDNIDPNPADTSAKHASEGQISTLHFVYSPYPFKTPWPMACSRSGCGYPTRTHRGAGSWQMPVFEGKKGPRRGGAVFTHRRSRRTGRTMRDLNANPLDYIERPL